MCHVIWVPLVAALVKLSLTVVDMLKSMKYLYSDLIQSVIKVNKSFANTFENTIIIKVQMLLRPIDKCML